MKFADIYAKAKEEGIDPEGGGGGYWDPEAGETYEVEVKAAKGGEKETTKKGHPKFGFQLVVTSGDDQGKSFWDNIYFSDSNKGNAISLGKFEVAGLDEEFFSADPSGEAVAEAMVGRSFRIKAGYNSEGYSRHRWLYLSDAEDFDADDDDDDDEVEEEAPKPKKKKKKNKKGKKPF